MLGFKTRFLQQWIPGGGECTDSRRCESCGGELVSDRDENSVNEVGRVGESVDRQAIRMYWVNSSTRMGLAASAMGTKACMASAAFISS